MLFIIIYLNPVAIGVLEIELFYTVYTIGDCILFPCPVFKFNIILFEIGDEIVDGSNAEAKVGVLIVRRFLFGAGKYMQGSRAAKAEPGMASIVKRLGNGIEADDLLIELSADF